MNLNPFFNSNDNGKQTAGNENRTTLVESIADLKTERADKIRPLTSDLQRATTAVEDAQQQLLLAKAQQHTADSKLRQATASYSHQIQRIESKIRDSSPDSIDSLIEQIKNKQRAILSETPPAPTPGISAKAKARAEARNLRIQGTTDRLSLLRESIAKAEGLRLSTDEDIDTGLKELRTALNMPQVH